MLTQHDLWSIEREMLTILGHRMSNGYYKPSWISEDEAQKLGALKDEDIEWLEAHGWIDPRSWEARDDSVLIGNGVRGITSIRRHRITSIRH